MKKSKQRVIVITVTTVFIGNRRGPFGFSGR